MLIAADLEKRVPLVCMTAYTQPIARLVDQRADLVLVGDSLGNVLYGMPTTVPVDLDLMIPHGRVVASTCKNALVVVDLPFGSYEESPEAAFRSAARVMKETGCGAVKLEGGVAMEATIAFLVKRGVPVLGHVGLMPQHANTIGLRKVRAAEQVLADALAVEAAGAFAVVLECVASEIAEEVTQRLRIPVIGIGCGHPCNGQIIVTEDILGLTESPPSFAKPLVDLAGQVSDAVTRYADGIKAKT